MFRHILAPIDGSAISDKGLKQAAQLAKERGSRLTVLHIVDLESLYRTVSIGFAPYHLDELENEMEKSGKQLLAKSLEYARNQGVKATGVLVKSGTLGVADVIVRQARKLRADLIVIGTHGRRGLSRLVMGSDAEGVVRQTTVPVMLVRPGTRKSGLARQKRPKVFTRAPLTK